jgi:5-methylcytosine-specific restriction endonuclease McrA
MARSRNSNVRGGGFSAAEKLSVWKKGRPIKDYDPAVWRYDYYGKPIKFSEYGNINSKHGWEIDHIKPVSRGGTDDLSNIQPLQWEANRDKGDKWPWP